jgi:hypothetical protein
MCRKLVLLALALYFLDIKSLQNVDRAGERLQSDGAQREKVQTKEGIHF